MGYLPDRESEKMFRTKVMAIYKELGDKAKKLLGIKTSSFVYLNISNQPLGPPYFVLASVMYFSGGMLSCAVS